MEIHKLGKSAQTGIPYTQSQLEQQGIMYQIAVGLDIDSSRAGPR